MIVENRDDVAMMAFRSAARKGFKVLLSTLETAMGTTSRFNPNGIVLGIDDDDMGGWALLDQLKHGEQTCYVPVHVVSAAANRSRAMQLGAFGFTPEPVDGKTNGVVVDGLKSYICRHDRSVLVVGETEGFRASTGTFFIGDDIRLTPVESHDGDADKPASAHFHSVDFVLTSDHPPPP